MSEQATQSALLARAFPVRAAMPWLVAAGSYLLLLILAPRLLGDPDIYWHISVGRWIVEHGAFPHVDPFSATFAGAPWIAKEWLSQLILAAAYHVAGWHGIAVLTAAAVAAALAVLAFALLEKLDPIAALGFVLAAFVLAAPHIVARPHALALPLMVLWTAALVRALDARKAPSLWLLPLITLWANLHGGFTFGLLLIGACALEAVLVAASAERKAVAWRWVRFGLLAALTACITPYGVESILMTRRILGLGEALGLITEWQPQDFSSFGAFEACLLGAVGLALYRGLTLPPVRILVVLGLTHMALTHVRNAELLALVAPLFLARPLCEQLGSGRQDVEAQPLRVVLAGVAAVIAIATGLVATQAIAPSRQVTPTAAVAALKGASAGPVLNDYNFGGYLIHEGIAPFIDGRSELYGGAFIARHHRALALQDLPGFLDLLEQYKIGVTLFAPERPAVALLDRLPQWERIYADDVAVVHIRKRAAR